MAPDFSPQSAEMMSAPHNDGNRRLSLVDIPNRVHIWWTTRERLGKACLLGIGATLTYMQLRHGVDGGTQNLPNHALIADTTQLAPTPDPDVPGGPWLYPDTTSTEIASAVPAPTPSKSTPVPIPITPVSKPTLESVSPAHTELFSEQTNERIIQPSGDTNIMEKLLCFASSTALIGGGMLLVLYKLGKRARRDDEPDDPIVFPALPPRS